MNSSASTLRGGRYLAYPMWQWEDGSYCVWHAYIYSEEVRQAINEMAKHASKTFDKTISEVLEGEK